MTKVQQRQGRKFGAGLNRPAGYKSAYENDIDVFIPELWANEAIGVFLENMVAASLVHRDFENVLQNYGDVINIPRPGEFTAKRKTNSDNVVIQDATADSIPVKLDQHVHTSFLIRDGEESKSFRSLVDEYLRPAVIAEARFVDQIVLGQYPHFMKNMSGGLANLTANNGKDALLGLRQVMNVNRAPVDGRNIILNPITETTLLSVDMFLDAQRVGDDGSALRNASLGQKMGFNFFMSQNMPVVLSGVNTTNNGAVNLAAGYPKGHAGAIVVDGVTGIIASGTWVTIAGEFVPHRVTAHAETSGNTTSITLDSPLQTAIADNAVITTVVPGAVNNASGYPAGYAKEITVDGFTVAPQVGQAVTFGTSGTSVVYSIIAVNGLVGILLDRPLEVALTDNTTVNLGPAGAFNLAIHKNAIALVVRPLARPRPGTGAISAVANYGGISMRIVITYDGEKQGHLVTVDMLCGVTVLDERLGGVLIS